MRYQFWFNADVGSFFPSMMPERVTFRAAQRILRQPVTTLATLCLSEPEHSFRLAGATAKNIWAGQLQFFFTSS